MSKFKTYFKAILIPLVVGGIVGIIMSGSIDYNTLKQPPLAPPSWLFPVVWTLLYILMGVSYGLLEEKGKLDNKAKVVYFVQLGINALWSIIFFVLKLRLLAFIWIILLDIAVIIYILTLYERDKTAGLLQIPYLVWISFATYLNYAVYLLNR